MSQHLLPYHIYPLGDAAITIDFGNCIDININKEVISRFIQFNEKPFPGMIEAIPAYSSLTIYYDLLYIKKKTGLASAYEWVKKELEQKLVQHVPAVPNKNINSVTIPVCYDKIVAPDLESLAATKNMSAEEVIHLHTSKRYKVFMLGFLPGFPYMGEVDERIAMPRKPQPVTVAAGSVGIAGKQTGIYPLESPGGWQIIGRTPLQLFDSRGEGSTLLQPGDMVQFHSISRDEFENY